MRMLSSDEKIIILSTMRYESQIAQKRIIYVVMIGTYVPSNDISLDPPQSKAFLETTEKPEANSFPSTAQVSTVWGEESIFVCVRVSERIYVCVYV